MTISVPSKKVLFAIAKDHQILLNFVKNQTAKGEIYNVLIKGNQGSGKSTLPYVYASSLGRPYAVVEVGWMSEPKEFFGNVSLKDGNTVFTPSLFTEAVQTPDCVIHLQELNRPESDKSLNAIFSILDPNQRSMWIDDLGDFVKVAPGVTFFGSLNDGFQFVGTQPLDTALEDRFPVKLVLSGLPREWMQTVLTTQHMIPAEMANAIMDKLAILQENVQDEGMEFSTRTIVELAKMVKGDVPLDVAIGAVIPSGLDGVESMNIAQHFSGQEVESGSDKSFNWYM